MDEPVFAPRRIRRAATNHGMRHTRVYRVWCKMKERCNNPANKSYRWYGAKGIMVCERWQTFENFFADMGEPPEGYTIERKDNALGYFLGNCKWLPAVDQPRNSSRCKINFQKAVEICVKAMAGTGNQVLAAEYGVEQGTIKRVLNGYSWPGAVEEANKRKDPSWCLARARELCPEGFFVCHHDCKIVPVYSRVCEYGVRCCIVSHSLSHAASKAAAKEG